MTHRTKFAKQLKAGGDEKEQIVIIYAFNSTGKTRLPKNYKDITKARRRCATQVFTYNARSEDIFRLG